LTYRAIIESLGGNVAEGQSDAIRLTEIGPSTGNVWNVKTLTDKYFGIA